MITPKTYYLLPNKIINFFTLLEGLGRTLTHYFSGRLSFKPLNKFLNWYQEEWQFRHD